MISNNLYLTQEVQINNNDVAVTPQEARKQLEAISQGIQAAVNRFDDVIRRLEPEKVVIRAKQTRKHGGIAFIKLDLLIP